MWTQPDAPRPPQPALLPLHGLAEKKPRFLEREVTVIGKARGTDIALESGDISHVHCVIARTPEGFRVRDCNSRCGIRINGEKVRHSPLLDGDILQIGTFSFLVNIPETLRLPAKPLTQDDVEHLRHSRRHLVQLALRLRKKIAKFNEKGLCVTPTELNRKATDLKAQIRTFDQRLNELEEAERELVEDREALHNERELHKRHVQQVELEMSQRLEEVDAQVRQAWQEFQQRCRQEEARLNHLARSVPEASPTSPLVEELQNLREKLDNQAAQLKCDKEQLARDQARLAKELKELHHQKEELAIMLEQLSNPSADHDDPVLTRVEAGLQQQRQDLARMMQDLEKMQAALHQRQDNDLQALLLDNEELRARVHELEKRVSGAADIDAPTDKQIRDLQSENHFLRQLLEVQNSTPAPAPVTVADPAQAQEIETLHHVLQQKDEEITTLKKQAAAAANASRGPLREADLENYETELNQFRQQLEKDRNKLNAEIEQLRSRNAELDEAVREMEMEMSRERAELARERTRLDRLREEVRLEMERVQREGPVRESLVNVNKLREEMTQRRQPQQPNALNDRLKNLRTRLND